jgi:hypothetical protein
MEGCCFLSGIFFNAFPAAKTRAAEQGQSRALSPLMRKNKGNRGIADR